MPKLDRRYPCSDCPWRRNSRRGWLGEDKPVSFFRSTITNEGEFPCHLDINYDDPNWRKTQLANASLCAGQLIFFRNWLKTPRIPVLAAAVRAVHTSRKVFETPTEFLRHHAANFDEKMVQWALWPFPSEEEEENEL
jgi:hypothetical protein